MFSSSDSMATGSQFDSCALFTFNNENHTQQRGFVRIKRGVSHSRRRRFGRVKKAVSSPALNSIDTGTSKSTPQNCFVFGQVSSFLDTNQLNTAEKTVEIASKLRLEKIEPGVVDKENDSTSRMSAPSPFDIKQKKVDSVPASFDIKQNMVEREANQEPATTSLIAVSRSLKGIPQNPHFYQLRNYSELTRKSMISSWDRIFEESVEQIQSLQINDFWVRARVLWKTMEELQTLGYNVIPLRKKLVELTDVMTELNLFKFEINELKIKAENHRMEKSWLESLILNLQEMIKKEHDNMERTLVHVAEMENDLPKFDGAFAKLAMEPL